MRVARSDVRRRARLTMAVVSGIAALSPSGVASAWCRTTSCSGQVGAKCVPAQPTDCGVELYWPKPCVGWSLQKDASSQIAFADAETLVQQAFATWATAACPAGGS